MEIDVLMLQGEDIQLDMVEVIQQCLSSHWTG